ncbi:MAG: hypothetical protein LQ340_000694 [Diploschistes diacapsis]|nr:MAG: hypothetical protein LQ340_000694 [Diploschistes diacapsis]
MDKHREYMRLALAEAYKSPPKPTNFRVGALIVDEAGDKVLATGYTLELPGNTHAEQCCLQKLIEVDGQGTEAEAEAEAVLQDLPEKTVLYTTMEPCSKRLSDNAPCVDRILRTRRGVNGGIKTVYVGVWEPDKFVEHNHGRQRLEANGVSVVHVPGLEEEILTVATTGHVQGRSN